MYLSLVKIGILHGINGRSTFYVPLIYRPFISAHDLLKDLAFITTVATVTFNILFIKKCFELKCYYP